ncbi:MAG: hypothetical protein DHS20C02_17750 [Micavibrio sp.]|nr:MAG: hypothetical protein DHS20C02_17750 [Micavibrio sp.]
MGFKRTAEGRVFFENPSEGEENKDLQIVGLLRALNERLKTAQGERAKLLKDMERYRETIDDLNERAVRSEQAYIDLEQKVSTRQNEGAKKAGRAEEVTRETLQELIDTREMVAELREKTILSEKSFSTLKEELSERKKTEELLRRHQLALEKLHKDQNEKIVGSVAAYVALTKRVNESETKFDTLDNKIGETVSEQGRLERKIEKAAQDRSRMLRKVDRIEETVIQTRDALNAKAMVVLADQGADGISTQKLLQEEPAPALLENQTNAQQSWWQRTSALQVAGISMFLVAAFLAGLLLSDIKLPKLQSSDKEVFSFLGETDSASLDQPPVFEQKEAVNIKDIESDTSLDLSADSAATIEPEAGAVINQMDIADMGVADDIGTLDLNDEDQLLAALENDPDGLAARLNEIEPSSVDVEEDAMQIATDPANVDANVIHTPQKTKTEIAPEEEELIISLKPRPGLENRIRPDPALTKVVKEIEDQAFTGIPEAQHDLAAIYTAGHGGVKQNYKRAGLWFQEAAEGGIANARYNLGVLYHQGLGVEQDTGKAIQWYKTAAELDHPEAQYNLGIAYIEGIGVIYDPHKAAGYFESAAASGVMEASYNLGLIYENALLGKAEPDRALKWYKTAADAGSPEAKAALEQLAKTLKLSVADVNKLVEGIGSTKAPVRKKAQAPKTQAPVKKAAVKKSPVKKAPVAVPEESRIEPAAGEANIEPTSRTLQQDSGRVLTAQVQEYLMQLGLYPGPADGLRGPLTLDAIRSYQLFNDLDDTGKVSEELLSHMRNDPQINEVGSREQ